MKRVLLLVVLKIAISYGFVGTAFGQTPTPSPEEQRAAAERALSQTSTGKTDTVQSKVDAELNVLRAQEQVIMARAAELRAIDNLKKAKKQQKPQEDKYVRQARDEANDTAEKEQKQNENNKKVIQIAAVSGCPKSTVLVETPIRSNQAENVIRIDRRGFDTSSWVVVTSVRITNKSSVAKDIDGPDGTLVQNLCPGGRIKLSFTRNIWTDSENREIPLNAVSSNLGTGTETQSFSLYLNASAINYQRVQPRQWDIYGR